MKIQTYFVHEEGIKNMGFAIFNPLHVRAVYFNHSDMVEFQDTREKKESLAICLENGLCTVIDVNGVQFYVKTADGEALGKLLWEEHRCELT